MPFFTAKALAGTSGDFVRIFSSGRNLMCFSRLRFRGRRGFFGGFGCHGRVSGFLFLLAGLQAPKPLLCHSCLLRPCIMVENLKYLTQTGIHLSQKSMNNDVIQPILRDKAISLMSDVYGLQYFAAFPHKVTCISYAIDHWFPTSIPYNPDSFDFDEFVATSDSESEASHWDY